MWYSSLTAYLSGYAEGRSLSSSRCSPGVCKNRADLRYHGCALANCATDTFDGARSHIAHREHAKQVRLQRQRPFGSALRWCAMPRDIRPRLNEALLVQTDAAVLEPVGSRICADKDKNVSDRLLCLAPGGGMPPANSLELRQGRAG